MPKLNNIQYQVLKNTFLSAQIPVAITLNNTINDISKAIEAISSNYITETGTSVFVNSENDYFEQLSIQQISLEDYHNLQELAPSTVYVISSDLMKGFKTEYLDTKKLTANDISSDNILANNISVSQGINSGKLITQGITIGDGQTGDRAFSQGYNIIANGTASFANGLNNRINSNANYTVVLGENNIATGAANLILGWYAGDNGKYRTFVCNFDRVYDSKGYPMDNLPGNIVESDPWYYLSGDLDLTYSKLSVQYEQPSAIYNGKLDILSSITWDEIETLHSADEWFQLSVYNQLTGKAGTDWKWYLARVVSSENIPAYSSKDSMTFNINLQNDVTDFYIGERNLQEVVRQQQDEYNEQISKALINEQSLYINNNDSYKTNLTTSRVKGQLFCVSSYYTNSTWYKNTPQYAHDYCYLNGITIIQTRISKSDSYNSSSKNNHDYTLIGMDKVQLSAAIIQDNEVGIGTQLKEYGYIKENNIIAFSTNTIQNYSNYIYQRVQINFDNIKLQTNKRYALVFFDNTYRYTDLSGNIIEDQTTLSDYAENTYTKWYHGRSIKIGSITNDTTNNNYLINDDYTINTGLYNRTAIVAMNVKFPQELIIEDSYGNSDGYHDIYAITINKGQIIPIKIGTSK